MEQPQHQPHPNIAFGERMTGHRERAQKAREKALYALNCQEERLTKLLDLARHPGFEVLIEELDEMLLGVGLEHPTTKFEREDRDGTIRALLGIRLTFKEVRARALRVAAEKAHL